MTMMEKPTQMPNLSLVLQEHVVSWRKFRPRLTRCAKFYRNYQYIKMSDNRINSGVILRWFSFNRVAGYQRIRASEEHASDSSDGAQDEPLFSWHHADGGQAGYTAAIASAKKVGQFRHHGGIRVWKRFTVLVSGWVKRCHGLLSYSRRCYSQLECAPG